MPCFLDALNKVLQKLQKTRDPLKLLGCECLFFFHGFWDLGEPSCECEFAWMVASIAFSAV